MTKTLTEQWREGTLKKGNYYVNAKDFYNGDLYKGEIDYFNGEAHWFRFAGVEEVLAPVPSYEEYRELLRHSELSRNLVYEVLVNQKEYNELLDKAKENKRLQERLAIAKKALKELETKSDKFYGCNDWSMQEQLDFIKANCQETLYQLKEMEGVK